MRPIAVIGGSGFVGRHVLALLKTHGRPFRNIDIRPATDQRTVIADIRDVAALSDAMKDCGEAIVLAAEWRDDVEPAIRYFDVNVGGARAWCDAAELAGVSRCIFVSSVAVYGPTDREVGEDHQHRPIGPYGQSKSEAEGLFRAWADRSPSRGLTIVRPTVIFGPGNRGNFWNLLNQIANGPFIMLGSGQNRKSIAYVENVAAFLVHCLDGPAGIRIFNYADKPDLDMNSLVRLVRVTMGRSPDIRFRLPQPLGLAGGRLLDALSRATGARFPITAERVLKFCANTQYAAEAAFATGFVPPVPVSQALRNTIQSEFQARGH